MRRLVPLLFLVLFCLGCGSGAADRITGSLTIDVAFPDSLGSGPVAGRLLVIFATDPELDPLWGPYPGELLVACEVRDWRPGQSRVVDAAKDSDPVCLDAVPPGEYLVRAILDTNVVDHGYGYVPGNLLSAKQPVTVLAGRHQKLVLPLVQVVPAWEFPETERIREEMIRSWLVSEFSGRDRRLSAAVVLPPGYDDHPERRYPTVYVIPGWGSRRQAIHWGDGQRQRYGMDEYGDDKVFVFLDHAVPEGYHCFADSDNLGPWGRALVTEFIPYLETHYRLIPSADARFLTGQSSGGWGAIWLQLNYPEQFGGCWAASPDYLDFRRFGHELDIYAAGVNVYQDAAGHERLADRSGRTTLRQAVRREELTGSGGQMAAFEAVYGPRAADGSPRPLFDRTSGVVDPAVAAAWARFDLGRVLRQQWPEHHDRLAGRLHVVMATDDPWFLDEPLELLQPELAARGLELDVRWVPGETHDCWSDETRAWMHGGIDALLSRSGLAFPDDR